MKRIETSEFETSCLELIDEVAETGKTLLITRNGKPLVELRSAKIRPRSLLGAHKGEIEIKGDIISPIDVKWEADR